MQMLFSPERDPDEDQALVLCIHKCRHGYKTVGPTCWQRCPSGYRDVEVAIESEKKTSASDLKSRPHCLHFLRSALSHSPVFLRRANVNETPLVCPEDVPSTQSAPQTGPSLPPFLHQCADDRRALNGAAQRRAGLSSIALRLQHQCMGVPTRATRLCTAPLERPKSPRCADGQRGQDHARARRGADPGGARRESG